MKKSYMTLMPDKSGAMLSAAQIIHRHGGNIIRGSYNKAVDVHAMFVDVEASPEALEKIEADLTRAGFLSETASHAKVVLMECELMDRPGTLIPILEVLSRHRISISYMSTQQNGTGRQYFKMGLYIEVPGVVDTILKEISVLCPVRILQYDAGEKTLDNTVFYLTFAGEMRRLLRLTQEQTNQFLYYTNLVMQRLDERNELPSRTFEYISRFAHFVAEHGGMAYECRTTRFQLSPLVYCTVLEPPCGSNITLLEDLASGRMLVVDSGFPCYQRYTMRRLRELYPDFDEREKEMLLTHSDNDHSGLASQFGVIHVSRRTARCFLDESEGRPCAREKNRDTLPYYRLSKIICEYTPPMQSQLRILDTQPCDDSKPYSRIGEFRFADLCFQVYQGYGGHTPGETVLIDEMHKVAITGDDYINIHGYTAPQKSFNRIAPYLMNSVNEDSRKAHVLLDELKKLLDGKGYTILPGHGLPVMPGQKM
ncbi:MAG: hypothetical protein IJ507_09040 [Clostridia bacterium]|nr:hypothetical protein [Clostridia bacterium]